MADPTENGEGKPAVSIPLVLQGIDVAILDAGARYEIMYAPDAGTASILLLWRLPVGLIGIRLDPDGASGLASALHRVSLQARSGLVAAKELPKDPPPGG